MGWECLGGGGGIGHVRRRCRECRKVYASKWRKTKKGAAYEKAYQKRIYNTPMFKAKTEVFKAVRKGSLKKASAFVCVDCGERAACYDHRNYSKPLLVQPVCVSCNKKRGKAH